MNAIFSGGFPAGRACDARRLPTFHLHQTEYPEIEPEGRKSVGACDRLLQLLVRAIEFACLVPRRPRLRPAVVDVRAFDPRCTGRS